MTSAPTARPDHRQPPDAGNWQPGVGERREVLVRMDRLTKRYGDRIAIDGVSLTVRKGEVFGVIGANGAGKTTLLRILAGLIAPTSGRVELDGAAIRPGRRRPRIGTLIEEPGFYPYLSARENLQVLARYCRLGTADIDRTLSQVNLLDRADDRYSRYSLGMKQRLGVAAALMGEPEVVVLDEPTNGLDPAGMADMRSLITTVADRGHTVVLSSHLLADAQAICQRVGILGQGRLLAEAPVDELRGRVTLRVRASPSNRALTVARRVAGDNRARPDGDAIAVDIDPSQAHRLASALLDDGLALHELQHCERSLEDVFFRLTATDNNEHWSTS